jgi:hypothetical protein
MCGRFDPSTDPVDAEQTKGEAVVLDRVFTDEIADNARDGCKNLFVPRDEAWISYDSGSGELLKLRIREKSY